MPRYKLVQKYFIYLITWEIQLHHPYFGNPTPYDKVIFFKHVEELHPFTSSKASWKGMIFMQEKRGQAPKPIPIKTKQNKYQNKNDKQLHQVFSAGFLSFKHMIQVLF